MILKASQRAGAKKLAEHLMNDRDNDHITLLELYGFISCNLEGALTEAYAISKGTQCKKFMFSLSLNPPKDYTATDEEFLRVADQAAKILNLDNQPRAVVIHEKEGRRHAHIVWSRIDVDEMKAIEQPFYKNRLTDLSREIYLENNWKLPEGLLTHGGKSPLNFSLTEWQQAKRQGVDPREIKQIMQEAWSRSDNQRSFKNAMEERGYFLARGDRRGFVALDVEGNIYSLSRWIGIKSAELKAKLGNTESLPSIDNTKADIQCRVTDQMRHFIHEVKNGQKKEIMPLLRERHDLKIIHEAERQHLRSKQDKRWIAETRQRYERLNKGLRGLFDWFSGKAGEIRSRNEREAYQSLLRDRKQRDDLFRAQMCEKQKLQKQVDKLRSKHAGDRQILARNIAQSLGHKTCYVQNPSHDPELDPDISGNRYLYPTLSL